MKKNLFFLSMLSALLLSAEGTVPVRYGKILSAESSSRKPRIVSNKMKDTSGGDLGGDRDPALSRKDDRNF